MADTPPNPMPTTPTNYAGVGGGVPDGFGAPQLSNSTNTSSLGGSYVGPGTYGGSSSSTTGGNQQNMDAAGGIVPLQGTGAQPQWNQPAAAVGGNQTPGFQYGIAPSGQIDQSKIAPGQARYTDVDSGENYQGKMQDAYYGQAKSRLDPQWNQRQSDMENQLQNMGLTRGSEAWNRESQNFGQQRNDAYNTAQNQAIMNSGAEAQRRQTMDIAQGDFGNKNTQQNYENQLTSQQAQNAAQNQQYNQNVGQLNANNQAITAQQGAAQGWTNLANNLEASKYNANAGVQAAGIGAGASIANNQTNAALEQRKIQNQERGQDFDMYWGAKNNALNYQNLAAGGMNPGNPNFSQLPGVQGAAGYQSGMNTGTQQGNSSIADFASGAGGQNLMDKGKSIWNSLGGIGVGSGLAANYDK